MEAHYGVVESHPGIVGSHQGVVEAHRGVVEAFFRQWILDICIIFLKRGFCSELTLKAPEGNAFKKQTEKIPRSNAPT
jgi:hypothetical protein